MVKQAVKKGAGIKAVSIADRRELLKAFKENNGIEKAVEKEPQWLIMPDAFVKATKINLPLGYCSRVRGKSNTGKSTIKLEVIKASIKQGILPVVFELENNFAWSHAKEMGIDVEEVVDEETGEILYGPGEDILYYDTAKLYELYGKYDHEHGKWLTKSNRDTYVIEDVAMCIRDLLRKQKDGELPFDMIFVIDSIGVGDCYRSAVNKSSNPMWFAAALSTSFNTIVNDLIPSSRNIKSPYLNTLFFIQKTWTQNTSMGLPRARSKGGESLDWGVRISIFLGGIESASIKALTATSGGKDYKYGIKTKIQIEKNHVSDITYTGEICSTVHGLWDPDKLDEYKKTYADEIKRKLAETNRVDISAIKDVEFTEVDEVDE